MAMRDLGTLLIQAKDVFEAIEVIIPEIATLIGSIFIFQGFLRLYKLGGYNPAHDVTIKSTISSFFAGAALLNYAKTKDVANSVAGLNGGLSYAINTGSSYMDDVVKSVLFIIYVFGMWSVFSAVLDAKKAGDGDRSGGEDLVAKAFWKFIGGAVAMNLNSFLN